MILFRSSAETYDKKFLVELFNYGRSVTLHDTVQGHCTLYLHITYEIHEVFNVQSHWMSIVSPSEEISVNGESKYRWMCRNRNKNRNKIHPHRMGNYIVYLCRVMKTKLTNCRISYNLFISNRNLKPIINCVFTIPKRDVSTQYREVFLSIYYETIERKLIQNALIFQMNEFNHGIHYGPRTVWLENLMKLTFEPLQYDNNNNII